MSAIYRNEHQAVALAMSVDRISTCRPASWQTDYRSGFAEELTSKPEPLEPLTTIERLAQDAMTRSLIKRHVDRMTFLALVAKYGTDDRERAAAINELADMLDSPGYDVCTIGMCGCRFLGLGTPFASDVKKGIIYAETPLHRNDDDLLLTHREAITQTGTGIPS